MTAVTSPAASADLPARLAVATIIATLVTLLSAATRVLEPLDGAHELLPALLAVAGILVALLARRRAPTLAWIAVIAASLVAATVPITAMAIVNARPHTADEWLPPALAVATSVIGTTVASALYATRPDRRLGDWVVPLVAIVGGWLGAACVLVVLLVSAGLRADPALTWADVATAPTTLYLHLVLLLVALGAAGDARRALARADARLVREGRPAGWAERLRLAVEELVPGLAERRDQDLTIERRRLASDLHASVLPSLRRAIAEAETGAGPNLLARRLREVDLELQRLLTDRWPTVLEAFGLVEALEELAEEAQTHATAVEIDVLAADGRPPATVERAAWRVAQLAVDNALRHAGARIVRLVVDVGPTRLALEIADDGVRLDDAALASLSQSKGRGVVDQRRQAELIGARLSLRRSEAGGLSVRLDWTANAGVGTRPDAGSSSTARDG